MTPLQIFFASIMAVFTLIGVGWTIIQATYFLRGRPKLRGELDFGTFTAPYDVLHLLDRWHRQFWLPFLQERLKAFNAQALAAASPDLMEKIATVLHEEMNQTQSVRFLEKLQSYWVLTVTNHGNSTLNDIIAYTPPVRAYTLDIIGDHIERHGNSNLSEFKQIRIGSLPPNGQVRIDIWCEEPPLLEAASDFSLVHANGRGDIDLKYHLGGWHGVMFRHYPLIATILTLLGVAFLAAIIQFLTE